VRRLGLLAALVGAALVAAPSSAAATRECDGHQVCVPVAGPWVVVSKPGRPQRSPVEYQLTCPRGHVVGGVDAELSHRAIDLRFLGLLGSPVSPGISTARSVVFRAAYVGRGAPAASFRPRAGCIPAAGAGTRIPTAATAFPPGEPAARRVRTVRVRPGTTTVTLACRGRERLVGASQAVGFDRRRPPGASLAGTVSAAGSPRADRVVVTVRADAELGGVRALVQVHVLCAVRR
jgi:hypothetical protein